MIEVEAPDGDELRHWPPFVDEEPLEFVVSRLRESGGASGARPRALADAV